MSSRLLSGCRNLLIPVILGFGLMLCFLLVFVGLVFRSPNPNLNPAESVALRLMMSLRRSDLDATAAPDTAMVKFVINPGDTAGSIGANLVAQGFISDADLFRNYVRYSGIDNKLQAGTYFLQKSDSLREIAAALINSGSNSVTVQVIEGWRSEQIAAAIDANPMLNFKGSDFLRLVGPGAVLPADFVKKNGIPAGKSLEGFLFPDTYSLPAGAPADELVNQMLAQFNAKINDQMRNDLRAKGLTLYQVITLASIVEREAVKDDERPIIASVYLNRLAVPMTLDADPGIQYALGNSRDSSTWWPNLTLDDYHGVISPYNTYINQGLPPGPIANPGISSIQAVIYPQTTTYLFFRADCSGNGRHRFSRTLAEQQANGCQ